MSELVVFDRRPTPDWPHLGPVVGKMLGVFEGFRNDTKFDNNSVILEIGAGSKNHIRSIFYNYANYISSDINPNSLKIRITDIPEQKISNDMSIQPFSDKSVDLVLMFKVLHEVPLERQTEVISEISRILKPGGHAIIQVDCFGDHKNEDITEFRNMMINIKDLTAHGMRWDMLISAAIDTLEMLPEEIYTIIENAKTVFDYLESNVNLPPEIEQLAMSLAIKLFGKQGMITRILKENKNIFINNLQKIAVRQNIKIHNLFQVQNRFFDNLVSIESKFKKNGLDIEIAHNFQYSVSTDSLASAEAKKSNAMGQETENYATLSTMALNAFSDDFPEITGGSSEINYPCAVLIISKPQEST